MKKDIVIIGGGVVGCAVARLLSAYEGSVTLLEKAVDVAEGASKANSGIVHAGFDAVPGSLKARLNVRGAGMYPELSRELDVPYAQPGALVIAFDEGGRGTLERLLDQGRQNGVPGLRVLEPRELFHMEPELNRSALCAIYAPTSGLTSPYEMTFALADHAAINGVTFCLSTEVKGIRRQAGGFRIDTNQGEFFAGIVVNCAGIHAAKIHQWLGGEPIHLVPRKGEYYLLDHEQTLPFAHTVFQTPTHMGKGVLISPTVHGNLLIGPTAEDIEDEEDVSTTARGLSETLQKGRLSWPGLNLRSLVTTFAGIRAHEAGDDFIVGSIAGTPRAYEAVGIESPGLTAAPAIAEMLCGLIARENRLTRKAAWKPPLARGQSFAAMSLEERAQAVRENNEYGGIVCRCEYVTEAEIRQAIRRPVGATTIDGVKRRVRAGMGRCQGGFCSPRVLEILAEEQRLSPLMVTKAGGESRLLWNGIEAVTREGERE